MMKLLFDKILLAKNICSQIRLEGIIMDENNVVVEGVKEPKQKKSKLDIAMGKYRKMKAMEKRVTDSAERERKAKEEQKKRREEKKAAEKAIAKAKKELAAVRAYADVKKEPSNIRKQYAVKGFFDLLDKCNAYDTRDFTDAYNFIGNTKWLLQALMQNVKVNKDEDRLEIDIGALRKNVFDKKAEVENIIEDFKAQLDKEWDELQKNKKEG